MAQTTSRLKRAQRATTSYHRTRTGAAYLALKTALSLLSRRDMGRWVSWANRVEAVKA